MTLFSQDHMLGTLQAANQAEVFQALANRAQELGVVANTSAIIADYTQREDEATTGFGGGIAIPHAKSAQVLTATVLFAKLDPAVDWDAIDDKPVDTVISLLVPLGENAEHLKLLSALSRRLGYPEFVQVLKNGSTDEVYELIASVLAGD